MRVGIFAKTFARPSLGETLDAVRAHRIGCLQFNMSCAGLPTMPEEIPAELAERIRVELDERNLTMPAVSGTFNMIHPDRGKRREGLRRLGVLADACGRLGTSVITLCTGTRDPEDKWRYHPENDSPGAWRDLLVSMEQAVRVAEEHEVTLAFEPEVNNVVDSAEKSRRLVDEIRSSRLKVVMDAANIFREGELPLLDEILDKAFELLGEDIVDRLRQGRQEYRPGGRSRTRRAGLRSVSRESARRRVRRACDPSRPGGVGGRKKCCFSPRQACEGSLF